MADATQPHSGSANSQPEVRAWAEQADAAGEDDAEYSDADYEYVDYDEFVAADDETDEVEGQDAAEAAAPRGRSWRWLRVLLAGLAKAAAVVIICGFAALSGIMVWQHHQTTQRHERAEAFADGAKKGIINMISLDFRKAKEDVQRVIDSSTGEFKDEFQQRAADFTKVVEQSKVVTEGTVTATAVESMDGNTALVLVSATSRVTNGGNGKEEPREWRLKVTVTEEDGQYKMSKVEFVP
ncbi:hypothetical protein PJK45_11025 [Mycobacterium kansasii]|uniref:VirB8 family protein n=3 Tax=Mycobacterium kansasii TaxID=1768 RepID=A0A653F710_MYCKA|nr:hypothetical protein [Mycobacterium kansasii]AGZ49874.1 hypothetical protein MKAN_05980 [Mycobacterium kansasii ATCC 12478]ARG58242.1 hypothetical protein B1T43_23070 [Mycobacterium kansasii]ARG63756.1 hypothetical protein B1T45_23615 [Mycobacterium kansasii]ARG71401.1 hypothetical protein B1T47_22960 [Mycobacterium kansasii]ARG74084.1 hypothetical protein B1T51_05775 [Mycobacterium kansasii]